LHDVGAIRPIAGRQIGAQPPGTAAVLAES
jgi:hypothetical protein